ncbi:MAG TPA: hypothetical protein PLG50_11885 [bacterium]|nr:hypothetical protein [bacterium]HQG46349.1 hypothetical protein [bacterium]HQI48064.1 hypothetical protein [bacterium]HQJ63318.1 hypothetical protein [bacterium]
MTLPSTPVTALESLSAKVGGFCGYQSCKDRKPSDQHLRNYLVTRIDTILAGLASLPPAPEEEQRLLAEAVHSTRRKLATISASLQDPTYEGQDFFIREQIADKRLSRIYDHEQEMLEKLDGIQAEVISLQKTQLGKEMIEDHFLHIADFIDTMNQALFERESLILGNQ